MRDRKKACNLSGSQNCRLKGSSGRDELLHDLPEGGGPLVSLGCLKFVMGL